MTSIAKDSIASSRVSHSTAAPHKGMGRQIWQIPLFLAGLALFGFGVRALIRVIRPVPFEIQISDIRGLLKGGRYVQAIDQINAIGNYYKAPLQQAQLQWLAGDAQYLAQSTQSGFVRENYQWAADHYRKAVTLGARPTPLMNERWGMAALALGDGPMGIEKLEAAVAQDPEKLLPHAHDLVAAYIATGNLPKAKGVVDRLLASEGKPLGVDERAWALCKAIELALLAQGGPADASHKDALQRAIDEASHGVATIPERDPAGRVLLWIGRAEFERGNLDAAKQSLEGARGRFIVHNLDDGRAAVLLGEIALTQGQPDAAGTLFQEVVTAQAGTPVWAAARLGRAEVLALRGDAGAQMESDYRFVIKTLLAPPPASIGEDKGAAELVNLEEVRASLTAQYERYAAADKLSEALKFLSLLGDLKDKETAPRAWAWATMREREARQLLALAAPSPAPATMPADPAAAEKLANDRKASAQNLLRQSAEDYLRHSKLTTMDDATSGNSLWKAAQLFDEAGDTMRAIELFDRFTKERPRDARVPEGLLAIGRLYQSVGMYDQAIAVYRKNIAQNPRTPAAYTSVANLARCYMNCGVGTPEDRFTQAEKVLLSLVQDNADILPTANEYRTSLFTLGELYYRNGKWADAILRLEECAQRYPDDKRLTRSLFMLAESYRGSAREIAEALKQDPALGNRAALAEARTKRLERAASLFDNVIAALDADADHAGAAPGGAGNLSPLEGEYLRRCYMDRAECFFQCADYSTAIKLYDLTATRFPQDITAIEAYVQIVNAYQSLQEPAQARAAAERARWVLKRIPDAAFEKGAVPLTRQYYEDFFKVSRGT